MTFVYGALIVLCTNSILKFTLVIHILSYYPGYTCLYKQFVLYL
ncbi:unnamed protein product [Brassica oleracea var. botrytis]